MVSINSASCCFSRAENSWVLTCKRHHKSKSSWTLFHEFYMPVVYDLGESPALHNSVLWLYLARRDIPSSFQTGCKFDAEVRDAFIIYLVEGYVMFHSFTSFGYAPLLLIFPVSATRVNDWFLEQTVVKWVEWKVFSIRSSYHIKPHSVGLQMDLKIPVWLSSKERLSAKKHSNSTCTQQELLEFHFNQEMTK